ncbi:type VII secretion system-associated protein [Streptomyces bohaiensis]|uniref:Type VII secretion system-associated protein n=1 Tax=Streptomyces bohaiensis TaxID=1431344 RepID=A0ABX1CA44_9ACTN|nr:type VII secretion system-associated protein [Streptomyces bohaiensis]NJQ16004.1 type VII secretion system-associated protein [Streptomyces bohaiensis]
MSTDDSGEGAGTLEMNKDGLRRFRENEVDAVRKAIEKIRKGDGAYSMRQLSGRESLDDSDMNDRQRPLALGRMVSGSGPGAAVNDNIKTVAGALDGILDDQVALFEQIMTNLETTIDELLEEQGASLEDIDGQAMLDVFVEVETELTGNYTSSDSSD